MEAGGAEEFFLGVDVGTGSVRAGIVSASGKLVASDTAEIQTWNPQVSILNCFLDREIQTGSLSITSTSNHRKIFGKLVVVLSEERYRLPGLDTPSSPFQAWDLTLLVPCTLSLPTSPPPPQHAPTLHSHAHL